MLKTEDATALFVEHKTHARHLESYLLSFTQVFLLVTGALWAYALARNSPRNTQYLQLVGFIFGFHLIYSFLGGLFSVRLSTNFRSHYEAAGLALKDAGLGKYVVLVPPENAEGRIEANSVLKLPGLLLTAKAFFLFIYVGAAAIDAYYLASERWGKTSWKSICTSLIVIAVFLCISAWVYHACRKPVQDADSTHKKK